MDHRSGNSSEFTGAQGGGGGSWSLEKGCECDEKRDMPPIYKWTSKISPHFAPGLRDSKEVVEIYFTPF